MQIGNYIRELRNARGISQEELGKIVGVQRAAVQKWESGKTQNLKRVTIQKLAEFFKVSPATFFVIGDIENPSSNVDPAIEIYNKLNAIGKQKALDYIQDLSEQDKYTKTENN